MKKLFLFFALLLFVGMNTNINAQGEITLIVCEQYEMERGPIGAGSVFTPGYVTIVALATSPMYFEKVYVQYDKMNKGGTYDFYKRFPFMFPDGNSIVYFSRVKTNDMEFNDIGFYTVFLLDRNENVIASTFVQIVN